LLHEQRRQRRIIPFCFTLKTSKNYTVAVMASLPEGLLLSMAKGGNTDQVMQLLLIQRPNVEAADEDGR